MSGAGGGAASGDAAGGGGAGVVAAALATRPRARVERLVEHLAGVAPAGGQVEHVGEAVAGADGGEHLERAVVEPAGRVAERRDRVRQAGDDTDRVVGPSVRVTQSTISAGVVFGGQWG